MKAKAIVLFSGGIDSLLILGGYAPRSSLALTVDYGQPSQELFAASELCRELQVQQKVVKIIDLFVRDKVTTTNYICGRNAVLLSCAISQAQFIGADEIYIGCNQDDRADYNDCRSDFISAMSEVFRDYNNGGVIKVPLIGMSKYHVVQEAKKLGLPIDGTFSCYNPKDGHPCRTCNACRLRNAAMSR